MALSLEAAYLIGALTSAILFGLYTALFIQVLLSVTRRGHARIIFISALVSLYVSTLAAIALQVAGVYLAFIKHRNDLGPDVYYEERYQQQLSAPIHLFQGVISDSLLCWRLYVIWHGNLFVMIAAICLLIGLIVTSAGAVTVEFLSAKSSQKDVDYWSIAGFGFTITVNVLVTGLICWRILHFSKSMTRTNERVNPLYSNLIRALIESGGIYTLTVVLYLIFSIAGLRHVSVIVSYMLSVIVGIVPNLILLRLHRELQKSSSHTIEESTSRSYGSRPNKRRLDQAESGIQLSEIRFTTPHSVDVKDSFASHTTLPMKTSLMPDEGSLHAKLDLDVVYTRET
ncbi:hypothetical protein FRC03_008445 [Tulasnella sp. 419]|nr:hypothetical protein FRC03_008445 [Tulasnella sp. 419]